MLFQLYGATAATQLLGWCLVFVGLILLNELGRTKFGGILVFFIIPAALTVLFIVAQVGKDSFASNWYLITHMNGWFHYAKLYAATIGCIGFIFLARKWTALGRAEWFKCWPFIIVGINILIAVVSDFESCIKGGLTGGWWVSNEGVFLYGGWWNLLNGIAGIINIVCMTGWFGVYSSKKGKLGKQDMLWPDMTWAFILAYDVWNFEYTYLNLPTHSWYCGLALLLAPTFAASFWNKGGWIQNRAFTLSIWCMFAQVVPFQLTKPFSVVPSLYKGAPQDGSAAGLMYEKAMELYNAGEKTGDAVNQAITDMGITADPKMQGIIAVAAVIVNVCVFAAIMKKACATKTNPYTKEIWKGTKDFEEAMAREENA
ncbi:MAG: DUF5692 family protein [Treponemataceae bacterium]|nr:DUF5692 family protein [Treponemataceae bacterium]